MSAQPESTERCDRCGREFCHVLDRPASSSAQEKLKCVQVGYERVSRALAEAEKALALSCGFGRADTIKLVETEAALRAAEERSAQAERERDFAKTEQERIASELRIHFKMRCAAEAKADAARGMLDRLVRSYAGDGPFISDLMPEAKAVLALQEASKARAPEAPEEVLLRCRDCGAVGLGVYRGMCDRCGGGGAQGEEK